MVDERGSSSHVLDLARKGHREGVTLFALTASSCFRIRNRKDMVASDAVLARLTLEEMSPTAAVPER